MTQVATGAQIGRLGKWNYLIRIPEVIPSASFLEGEGSQEFYDESNRSADAKYGVAARNVKTFTLQNGVVMGCSPISAIHARDTARAMGLKDIRLATQADLEQALATKALNLSGTYEDSALVLRSAGDRDYPNNDYVARSLADQIRARDPRLGKLRQPVVIPLNGLNIVQDGGSDYGLVFQLREDAELIEAPILNRGGQFSSKDIDLQTGLPKQLSGGNRNLYTQDNGLSRLYLDRGLDLYSGDGSLADSSSGGRVVLVRGEAVSAEFAAKYQADIESGKSELAAKYQADRAALEKRFAAAMEVFRGGNS